MNKGLHGLRTKMVVALIISFVVAGVFYEVFGFFGETYLLSDAMDDYFGYEQMRNAKAMDQFEQYVSQNKLSYHDFTGIQDWLNKPRISYIDMVIYADDQIQFGDNYTIWEEIDGEFVISDETYNYLASYDGVAVRQIAFTDGSATVYLYGYFTHELYVFYYYTRLALSAFLMILTFLLLIQRKVKYIRQLEREIKVLETGGMDHPITIKGKDELGSLASSLEQMRIALNENMEDRERIATENNQLVVSVAHDVRTPLTSLSLYLDMLHKEPNLPEETKLQYLEKARTKTVQIKHMTDQLFEQFRAPLTECTEAATPYVATKLSFVSVEDAWSDMLSCFVADLIDQGFTVECEITWPNHSIVMNQDLQGRILDNLYSNLLKYASMEKPIRLQVTGSLEETCELADQGTNYMLLSIRNHQKEEMGNVESSGQGLINIRSMVSELQGMVQISEMPKEFMVGIYLPVK